MRWPASMPSADSDACPSEISEMSVLVPPMSNGTRSGIPSRSAQRRPPDMPPAGPDSTVPAASREASSTGAMPPCDSTTNRLPLNPASVKPLLEIGQIAPHDRFDIGVHDRGRDALIFLDLRQHVAGARYADVRQFSRQTFDRGEFVHRIEIGMQEAHRDRGRAGFLDRGDGLVQRGLIEWNQDLAIRLEPLAHAKSQFARHQRLRRRRAQIVAVGLEALAHFDDVAMAFGGQQRDLGALALQQRVGRNRRAMNQAIGRSQHFRARDV